MVQSYSIHEPRSTLVACQGALAPGCVIGRWAPLREKDLRPYGRHRIPLQPARQSASTIGPCRTALWICGAIGADTLRAAPRPPTRPYRRTMTSRASFVCVAVRRQRSRHRRSRRCVSRASRGKNPRRAARCRTGSATAVLVPRQPPDLSSAWSTPTRPRPARTRRPNPRRPSPSRHWAPRRPERRVRLQRLARPTRNKRWMRAMTRTWKSAYRRSGMRCGCTRRTSGTRLICVLRRRIGAPIAPHALGVRSGLARVPTAQRRALPPWVPR